VNGISKIIKNYNHYKTLIYNKSKLKIMETKKANELIQKYGKTQANNVCDDIITELQLNWNQERIDFYLDIKLIINRK